MAAKAFGYRWEEFCDLEGEEQSAVVEAYRTEKQIEAVIAHVQAEEMKRESKKRPRKR